MQDHNNITKTLSYAKQKFKAENYDPIGYLLCVNDYPKLTDHYWKKHKIKIYLNGQTPFGLSLIAKRKLALQQEAESKIASLTDDKQKYASYCLIKAENYEEPVEFIDLFKEITCYLMKTGATSWSYSELTRVLTQAEIYAINIICKTMLHEIIEEKLVIETDKFVTRINTKLQEKLADYCLTLDQATLEIKEIQNCLADNETVGYIFTDDHSHKGSHFEVLIISKNEIVKPIIWSNEKCSPYDFAKLYFNGIARLAAEKYNKEFALPQSDGHGCATLGLLYLKELLKDNAYQLNELSLRFSYYDSAGIVNYHFIPSPQVLRYSQSKSYNQLIRDFIMEEESFVTTEKFKTNRIVTLSALLKSSLITAKSKQNASMITHHGMLLSQLTTFREKWLKAYDEARQMRDLMNKKVEQLTFNLYLSYSTRRMERIISKKKHRNDVPAEEESQKKKPRSAEPSEGQIPTPVNGNS